MSKKASYVALALLLLLLVCADALTFYPSATDQEIRDVSDMTERDNQREGRVYWFSNGTAIVNTTTVAVAAGFAAIIGLGVASVFHEAVLNAFPTAPGNAEEEEGPGGSAAKVDLELHHQHLLTEEQFERYHREMAKYEVEYQQYLRDYKAWAEVFGQDPTPPEQRGETRGGRRLRKR